MTALTTQGGKLIVRGPVLSLSTACCDACECPPTEECFGNTGVSVTYDSDRGPWQDNDSRDCLFNSPYDSGQITEYYTRFRPPGSNDQLVVSLYWRCVCGTVIWGTLTTADVYLEEYASYGVFVREYWQPANQPWPSAVPVEAANLVQCEKPTSFQVNGSFSAPTLVARELYSFVVGGGLYGLNLLSSDADSLITQAIADGNLPEDFVAPAPFSAPAVQWTWS